MHEGVFFTGFLLCYVGLWGGGEEVGWGENDLWQGRGDYAISRLIVERSHEAGKTGAIRIDKVRVSASLPPFGRERLAGLSFNFWWGFAF